MFYFRLGTKFKKKIDKKNAASLIYPPPFKFPKKEPYVFPI